jgi:hypothetical protein
MNPNLWGPDTWTVLHGIGFLEPSNLKVPELLQLLNYLLPCVICRNSFAIYFSLQEATKAFRNQKGAEYIFDLHNKVNDKLENQRLDKFISACNIKDPNIIQSMKYNFRIMSSRPTFDIAKKRFLLRSDYPFSLRNVYLMLSNFLVVMKDDKSENENLPHIIEFITILSILLRNESFQDLAYEMTKLYSSNQLNIFLYFSLICKIQGSDPETSWNTLRQNMHSY